VVVLADAHDPAVLAPAPDAIMLADAGGTAVLALAHAAIMLADAGAPAVLAGDLWRLFSNFLRPPCGALTRCLCLSILKQIRAGN
jgi:hypothetical protein